MHFIRVRDIEINGKDQLAGFDVHVHVCNQFTMVPIDRTVKTISKTYNGNEARDERSTLTTSFICHQVELRFKLTFSHQNKPLW